jgi:hypothetical protein
LAPAVPVGNAAGQTARRRQPGSVGAGGGLPDGDMVGAGGGMPDSKEVGADGCSAVSRRQVWRGRWPVGGRWDRRRQWPAGRRGDGGLSDSEETVARRSARMEAYRRPLFCREKRHDEKEENKSDA